MLRSLVRQVDEIEDGIRRLAAAEQSTHHRPAVDGSRVMELLDLARGPAVGAALAALRQAEDQEGPIDERRAADVLRRWWDQRDGVTAGTR